MKRLDERNGPFQSLRGESANRKGPTKKGGGFEHLLKTQSDEKDNLLNSSRNIFTKLTLSFSLDIFNQVLQMNWSQRVHFKGP